MDFSVIHFVSTNINPAPKKKHIKEKFLFFILIILLRNIIEETINNITSVFIFSTQSKLISLTLSKVKDGTPDASILPAIPIIDLIN